MLQTASILVSGAIVLFATAASSKEASQQNLLAGTMARAEVACRSLVDIDFAQVPEAPAQIVGARVVSPEDAAPFCLVSGYIAPNVGIKAGLPLNWNSKLIELGCGGHCGRLPDDAEFARSSFLNCGAPLRRGYACIISDMGHRGTGDDSLWAEGDLQAVIDWGYRATHVTALAGKAITQKFYQQAPAHSYFSGCSTGGRQALQEAQRFPWDFDGVIAGAPPIRLADLYVTFAWGQQAAHDMGGKPLLTLADLKLLTQGALARCDMDDGVRDGIISSPLQCSFRASDLACRPGQLLGCLTPAKIQAAQKIYSGPTDSQGHSLFGAGAAPGSELGEPELEKKGGNWGIYYLGTDSTPPAYAGLTRDGLKDLFFSPRKSPDWTIRDFDFDNDYKRLDVMQSLYDSSNPDLHRFKSAGGKMLMYHGLNDLSILPQWIIQYYENVERLMGGRDQTQSFVRLFSLPGVEHCGGGPGADIVDYLTYLEDWVERGKPPDRLVSAHLRTGDWTHPPVFPLQRTNIAFTRPVYPYPVKTRYLGTGDRDDASNFGPSAP